MAKTIAAALLSMVKKKKGFKNFKVIKSIEMNLTSGQAGGIIKLLPKEILQFQQLQMSDKNRQNDKSNYNDFLVEEVMVNNSLSLGHNVSSNFLLLLAFLGHLCTFYIRLLF